MKSRLLLALGLLVIASSIFYFGLYTQKRDDAFSHPEILDYIYLKGTPVNPAIKKADALKYDQNYPKAAASFQKLLQSGPLSTDEKQYVLNQLAYIHLNMNEDSLAHTYIDSIELFRPLSKEAEADYFYNVGVWAYHTFKPKMAEGYLRRALEGFENYFGKNHLKLGLVLTQLGLLHYEFTKIPDSTYKYMPLANNVFQNNLALRQFSAENEFGMSWVSYSRFDNEGALAHCNSALQILKSGKYYNNQLYARCLSQKGRILKKKGDLEKDDKIKNSFFNEARILNEQALVIGKLSSGVRQQELYRNAIMFYALIKDTTNFNLGINKLEKVLKIQQNRFGQIDWFRGMWFDFNNNTDEALYYYKKAWDNYYLDSVQERRILADLSYNLYLQYKQKKNYDSSVYFIKQNILLGTKYFGKEINWSDILKPEIINTKKLVYNTCIEAADCLLNGYYNSGNRKLLEESLYILKKTDVLMFSKPLITDEDAITSFQKEFGDKVDIIALGILYNLYKMSKNKEYVNNAFKFMERMKSMVLYRNIKTINEFKYKAPSESILDSIRVLNNEIAKLKSINLQNQSISFSLSASQKKLEDLYEKIKKIYPDYYQARVIQEIPDINQVQKSLKDNEILVFYRFGDIKWYTLVVGKNNIEFVEKNNVNIVNLKIDSLKSYLYEAKSSVSEFVLCSSLLYGELLKNVVEKFDKTKKIVIFPDKKLNTIPFEVLLKTRIDNNSSFKNLDYVLNHYDFVYSSSWKVYNANKNITLLPTSKITAFTYSFTSKELPYSKDEIKAIDNYYKDRFILFTDNYCSSENFKKQINNFDIIHLSLHAYSNIYNKFDTKIFFAPKMKDTLYGFDIIREKTKAQLAILSACQTLVGIQEGSEGTFTLARSFQQCGAKMVIASLWKIDNATTAQIFTKFYKDISEGISPVVALSNSKRFFLKLNNNYLCDPKYWSGLICLN